jgi:hypothetical protein
MMMVESCMCSSHRKDFCWIWTQPNPLSDVGSGSFKESSSEHDSGVRVRNSSRVVCHKWWWVMIPKYWWW